MSKKSLGYGFRGTLMIIYQTIAFYIFCLFNAFAQNIQAAGNEMMFGWSAARVSQVYTVIILVGVFFQLLFSRKIANSKSVKWLSIIFLSISILCGFGMATLFANESLWLVLFAMSIFFSQVGSTFLVGILIGQWFPRRKGTVMGITTLAFPITTGVFLSIFAKNYFTKGPFIAYLPFLIVAIIGVIIAIVFLSDYPEQCGAYPDNDKNMDPETAKALLANEIELKKKSVWTVKNTLKCKDFWFMVIPEGILLATSVGAMVKMFDILSYYPDFFAKYGTIALIMVTVFACLGSYILGLIDTKFGTKKAVIISCIFAVLTGVLGIIASLPTLIIGFYLLIIYMGAGSNFAVSLTAQYWKREDFAAVYGVFNPVANIIQAFGPMLVIMVGGRFGYHIALGVIGIHGVIALILICMVNPKRIDAIDRKYRQEAGLPVTDEK